MCVAYNNLMAKQFFIRSTRAGEQLELFLVSAVSSVLLVRFYLHITNYPQIGGDGLHIAHMLWGGLLMLVSLVLLFAFIGYRSQRLAALIGGIGFGVFIDELGKFITRDNDYFFQPAVALIYAVFMVLFILFRFLTRRLELTSKEYMLNALDRLEDVVLDDFDESEKKRVDELLRNVDSDNAFAKQLKQIVGTARVRPVQKQRFTFVTTTRRWIDENYLRLLKKRYSSRLVKLFFIAEAILFLTSISLVIASSIYEVITDRDVIIPEGLFGVAIAEAVSASIAAVFVLAGVYKFSRSRLEAYELFQQATIVQIFLTSFFMFYRDEFNALPAFLFNVIVLIALRAILAAEERIATGGSSGKSQ